jgi:fumarylacetoacetase
MIDWTHEPGRTSWVESANRPGCDFPLQNLPFGVFRRKGSQEAPRGGVAIGDQVFDLAALGMKTGPNLNVLAASGKSVWKQLRSVLSKSLAVGGYSKKLTRWLVPIRQCELFLPVAVGDYSDFYAGIHHAMNMGRMLRPDNPLLPNYKWVPIGYHGRGSSIVVSGTPVVRPHGQVKPPDAPAPSFGPSRRLDYEVELGFIAGPGNKLGRPIPISRAPDHVFGVVLLNDWSARDIQAWEYQPLGPFLAKSFASTVSPWVVTMEALAPYRCPAFPRAESDPRPLPHLLDEKDQQAGGIEIEIDLFLRSDAMRAKKLQAARLSRSNFRDSYWTIAQLVAHQSSNGCNLQFGDLLGSGTISGVEPGTAGSIMELTSAGKNPVELPGLEKRSFLEDGDEVTMRGRCAREGRATIGFGKAAGRILPAI